MAAIFIRLVKHQCKYSIIACEEIQFLKNCELRLARYKAHPACLCCKLPSNSSSSPAIGGIYIGQVKYFNLSEEILEI